MAMLPLAETTTDTSNESLIMLSLGGAGLYFATRFATRALIGPKGLASASGGMVALGQWMPIAAVAATALIAGLPEVAVGILFATSVASLSLGAGMITLFVPNESTPPERRAWPFLLPAALLIFLAGLGGGINAVHALMIAALGVAVGAVWFGARKPAAAGGIPAAEAMPTAAAEQDTGESVKVVSVHSAPPEVEGRHQTVIRGFEWALSCGVAIVAAWYAVKGTRLIDEGPWRLPASLIAAGVISPLLTLPLLASGTDMAQRNRSGEALSACIGVALLNLFVLLPLLVIARWGLLISEGSAWPAMAIHWPDSGSSFSRATHFVWQLPSLSLPTLNWRVDTVVLAVLGFAVIPIATGRTRVGRLEAFGLILAYAVYLVAVASLLTRPGGV